MAMLAILITYMEMKISDSLRTMFI
jgi:hypothetical protein